MLVSIIITNYNYEPYLARAIDSALAQDHRPVEVLVVDDGSRDGSAAVIEAYGNRVVPIFKANGGQSSSANAGFAASRGEAVVFLDADDELLEDAVSRHVARLRRGAVKSCGYMDVIDTEGRLTGERIPQQLPQSGNYLGETLRHGLDTYQTSFTSGHAWSRKFLTEVFPLPEVDLIGVDGYLTAVDRLFGPIEFIHQPVARYRVHGGNKGPVTFNFDAGHLDNLIRRKNYRTAYAEDWLERLGHPVDRQAFRRPRNWRLTLMQHALGLMDEHKPRVSLGQLLATPFRRRPLSVAGSLAAAASLLAVRLLPKREALKLTQRLLHRGRAAQPAPQRRRAVGRLSRASPSE